MPTWTERRFDRSSVLSEALDKLLEHSAKKHDLLSAVVADQAGLLVASASNDKEAEKVAGVVATLTSLRRVMENHDVLDGMNHAVFRGGDRRHLIAWTFSVKDEEMLLALTVGGELPDIELEKHLIDGVRRIFSTLQGTAS